MKIHIVGAGPAGLYLAILMKKQDADHEIHVYERAPRDATWGFGVVFSDETLSHFLDADPPTYRRIVESFAYWDVIRTTIGRRGRADVTIDSGGHGFCGMSRLKLLNILQDRAEALGVSLHFNHNVEDVETLRDADLLVGADGINSRIRDVWRERFQPDIEWRRNRFCWLGTTLPLDAFHFIFREGPHGWVWAHAYRFEEGRSTWIVECSEATWRGARLDYAGEAETVAYMADIFAADLGDHGLLTNNSIWRSFPVVRNRHWHFDNVVLLGDAAHSAHFSIGSGTRLAMEDAIALSDAFGRGATVAGALAAYEQSHRVETEILQRTAGVSLAWFEHVDRYAAMDPEQFTFSMLTRSKRTTYENLELRDRGYSDAARTWFARHVRRTTGIGGDESAVPMFQPFRLRGMELVNRTVMSPMCQYSAEDGNLTDWHFVHYCSRALGGPGLVYTEMTCISPQGRISPGCTGLWNDHQAGQWRRVVDFIHRHSQAKVCMQLGHSGRKGSTRLAWEGVDQPLAEGGWEIIAPSPIPYLVDGQVPRPMSRADMDRVRDDFVRAARLAEQAGFDMLELHMAHGYLLSSFISPVSNRRTDEYGGAIGNRMRLPLECVAAVRAVWPGERPLSVRISATDWVANGLDEGDRLAVAAMFRDAGVDLINVSTGQVTADEQPVYGRMFQAPFSDQIRNEVGIATLVAGNITSADQVNTLLLAGRADLVALARPILTRPHFVLEAAAHYGYADQYWPPQYRGGGRQAMALAERNNRELAALRQAARPPRPAEALAVAIARSRLLEGDQ